MIVNTDWSNIDKKNLDSCVVFRCYSASFSIKPRGAWEGTLYYSIDGITWHEVVKNQYITSQLVNDSYSIYMKGINNTVITGSYLYDSGWGKIVLRDIYVFGNIETLLDYRTVLNEQHPTIGSHAFYGLFATWDKLVSAPSLPATSLSDYCYAFMFNGCTSLTTAPSLPATSLSDYCYEYMFDGCTSLTTAPSLPATTLADSCYHYMFSNCTSLTTAPPSLPATTLADSCYAGMFNGCTSLTTAPSSLPATAGKDCCYDSMFKDCTSLTTAPSIAATTLRIGRDCFAMFDGCTSLTIVPQLKFKTIPQEACIYMFRNCSNVKVASSSSSTYVNEFFAFDTLLDSEATEFMLNGTTGTFTGDPVAGVTYYTSNPVV